MRPYRYWGFHTLIVTGSFLMHTFVTQAQPFVRLAPILYDSVPIIVDWASNAHGFPPLNMHCVCLVVPDGLKGKVLAEFTGASDKGFSGIYGYAIGGLFHACFSMRLMEYRQGGFYYEGRRMWYLTLRKPPERRF